MDDGADQIAGDIIAVFWPPSPALEDCQRAQIGFSFPLSTTKAAKARYYNGKALGYIYDRHPICPTQVSFHYSWVHTANLLGQQTIGTRRLWAPKDL